jgi:hypothetical protein
MPRAPRRHRAAFAAFIVFCSASVAPNVAAQRDTATRIADSVGRRRIQPLPVLGSAPETGLQYGAAMLAVWEQPRTRHARPASITASAVRTAKSQTRIGIVGEHWSRKNARRIAASLQWQEYPLPFYGIGNAAPTTALETFTPRGTEATLTVQQRVADGWYVTAGGRHLTQRLSFDTVGALRNRQLTGTAAGRITEWSGGLQRDTRDNLFAPHRGEWMQLSYARSVDGFLSDYSYGTARLDARTYHAWPKGFVFATQTQIIAVDGGAPFDQLALVGNSDILRGYTRGRYRDRAVAATQTELRSPLWHRVGWVAFGGLGATASKLAALNGAILLPTYGAGVRMQLDERQRTGIRADYGRGRDGASGLYIGFNQAF